MRLHHRRVHAKDCEDCETEQGFLDVIEKEVVLEGAQLTEEHRTRLYEIAGRCPVQKTLEGEVKIRSSLAGRTA